MTFAGGAHQRQQRAHTVDHTPQVDADDPFPDLECQVVDRSGGDDTGVQVGDVHRAVARQRLGAQPIPVVDASDIISIASTSS